MFNKSQGLPPEPVEPTLAERLNGASANSAYARNAFLVAALDLESAANELDIIAQDAQREIDAYVEILVQAIEGSDANRLAAKNLRSLVEVEGI